MLGKRREKRRMTLGDLVGILRECYCFRGTKAGALGVRGLEEQKQISLANVDDSFRGRFYSCLDLFVAVLDWLLRNDLCETC